MNALIAWVADRSGFAKVWAFLDGKKTYLSAAAGILTSLLGLANQLAPIATDHNTAAFLNWLQLLPTNTSWLSLVAACGLLGLGHANAKASQTP